MTVDVAHQGEDAFTRLVVEVGRRFIGQHHGRVGDQGAGDGHALPLATTQLVRAVFRELRQIHHVQHLLHALAPLLAADLGHLQQRVLDVLLGAQHRKKIEGLEDEADGTGTQARQLVGRLAADIVAGDRHASAGGGVDAADDVQHRRLAAARGAGDGEEGTGVDGERHVVQGAHHVVAEAVFLDDVLKGDDGHARLPGCHRVIMIGMQLLCCEDI